MSKRAARILNKRLYIKYLFILVLVFNLVLPLGSSSALGVTMIVQWAALVPLTLSLLGGLGIPHSSPVYLGSTITVRSFEMVYYYFVPWESLNWLTFLILIIVDFVCLGYLIWFRGKFHYIEGE